MRVHIAVFVGMLGICRIARAEPVNPTPASPAGGVAVEQHPIQVGDVIMAPAVEPAQEEAHVIHRPGEAGGAKAAAPKRWYGLPILVTDSAAYVLLATAVTNDESAPTVLPISVPTYALGGPITHAANGHWGRAGLSLLMRAGLPLTGVIIGAGGCGRGDSDCASSVVSGAIAGMAIASLVDLAALSWETVEPPRASSLQPSLALSREAAWVGASGRF